MNTAANIMELDHVSVRYKSRRSFFRHTYFTALDEVSFSIIKGETLGIVGTNGCGKSTLLRVLANIYGIDAGQVNWYCRQVSLLTLALGFDPELSGRDNAILSGMLLGARKADVLDKIDEIIEFSELKDFIYKPIKTYSTGMRARLGFSVAVTMQSELLLIDEVMSVGDGKFKRKAEAAMVNKISSDQTVVLVSHSLPQLSKVCDRVLWLNEGKVIMIGAVDEVLQEYECFLEKR
ncbi:MAG: ABC transporter ATP-binding protein [Proteobacteria bacterium]|nr:ABC transporter ATP-binding protein [Pseudomonadota bacterium]